MGCHRRQKSWIFLLDYCSLWHPIECALIMCIILFVQSVYTTAYNWNKKNITTSCNPVCIITKKSVWWKSSFVTFNRNTQREVYSVKNTLRSCALSSALLPAVNQWFLIWIKNLLSNHKQTELPLLADMKQ